MIAINLGFDVQVTLEADRKIRSEGAYIAGRRPQESERLTSFRINDRDHDFLVNYERKEDNQLIQFHQLDDPPVPMTGEQVNVLLNYLYKNLEIKE